MEEVKDLERMCEHFYVMKIDIEEEFPIDGGRVRFHPKYMCKGCNRSFVDKLDGYVSAGNGFYRKK